jgi:hypothetical protein
MARPASPTVSPDDVPDPGQAEIGRDGIPAGPRTAAAQHPSPAEADGNSQFSPVHGESPANGPGEPSAPSGAPPATAPSGESLARDLPMSPGPDHGDGSEDAGPPVEQPPGGARLHAPERLPVPIADAPHLPGPPHQDSGEGAAPDPPPGAGTGPGGDAPGGMPATGPQERQRDGHATPNGSEPAIGEGAYPPPSSMKPAPGEVCPLADQGLDLDVDLLLQIYAVLRGASHDDAPAPAPGPGPCGSLGGPEGTP